jgi:hypothetical protein
MRRGVDAGTRVADELARFRCHSTTRVHNWMVYGAGDILVGDYSSTNLANIGIGHGAVDGGGGILVDRYCGRPLAEYAMAPQQIPALFRPKHTRCIESAGRNN